MNGTRKDCIEVVNIDPERYALSFIKSLAPNLQL